MAIKIGDLKAAKEAIKNGADVNSTEDSLWGMKPALYWVMHRALADYHVTHIKGLGLLALLLENNVDVNAKMVDGSTVNALESVLLNKNPRLDLPIIKMLFAYGADLYHVGKNGKTMLETAKEQSPEIKKIVEDYAELLEKFKSTDPKVLGDALREAIANDYHLIVLDLIKRGIPVYESDLKLAKEHDSKRSGRIILKQLGLTCPVGSISRTGLKQTGLDEELLDTIARFTH